MSSLGSWHSEEYAAEWARHDAMRDMLVLPRQISAALVVDAALDVKRVLDIGSGPGAYLEVFLRTFPEAEGVWIDFSEAMLDLARRELAPLSERITFEITDAEHLEAAGLSEAQVVVTSRMVHHFSAQSVHRFYATAFGLLAPGGFFFNLDHCGAPPGWEERYRRIRPRFSGSPKRQRPHRHDHPFYPVEKHLRALRDAGFEEPDVPWRNFYTNLLSARKPV